MRPMNVTMRRREPYQPRALFKYISSIVFIVSNLDELGYSLYDLPLLYLLLPLLYAM